jgi:amino acid adenylation domain-containing protein/thioester reductase-like protein
LSENTEKRIYEIEIITELEKKQILYEFNNTKTKYTKDITIHELFEKQVEITPNNLAIISNNRNISYIELNNQANKLALILRKLGVKPSGLVCIIIDRSIEMIIGTMGILKSGGAYIPIEPNLPELRIRRLLKELNVKIIITSSLWLKKIDEITNNISGIDHIISLDEPDNQEIQKLFINKKFLSNHDFKNNPSANLKQQSKPEDIAYIIFTSGSTGLPKGVVEQHKPVVNVIEWINKKFSVTEHDKLLFIASLGFDLSVYDIFGTLSSGATIHLLSSEEIKDPNYIVDIVLNEDITIWDSTPAALQQLVPLLPEKSKNNKLRLVLLSGDWIPLTLPPILKETFEGVNVISLGGATEATIWSNYFPIGEINPNWNSIPYGKPIQNAKYYILNNKLKICPIGVTGDLYIGGKCLSLGYINDPELSSNKFISNPFIAGEKMYKTGDLARLMPDLNIEFLGRIDNQVKIRGFRIELGEIENCLLQHELIKGTAVIARTNKIGDKYLCAYLVLKSYEFVNTTIKDLELQEYLAESLPDYMIPAHFVEIEKIPLTLNGKIDKKKLPEPEIKSGENYFAPSNKTEEKLIEICSEVLEIEKEQIDINASFFEHGGNSLNAVKIVGKLIHDFEISIADIFKYATLAELASNISYKKGYLIERIEELKKSAKYAILDIVRDNLSKEKQEYEKRLKKEKLVGIKKRVKYQNILVTGATGYLGAHIVYDLLKVTKSIIYLIVRGESNADAEIRLKSKLSFYFGEKIVEKYKRRLVVIKGDLRDNIFGIEVEKYRFLSKIIDTIIHSSANVRHYGKYEDFYKDNVISTESLLEFALNDKKKSFHYISTTAVKAGNIKNKKYSLYTEYYKDEDQQSDNLYVLTKQEAERKVLSYRKKGLNGSIYRVGNLSFHSSTGKFQENINENAFYSRIKEFMQLGHLPSEVISDISFIDYVSKAIVLLLTRKHLSNEIYHIYNSEFALTLDELSEVFSNVGLKIKFVSYEQFLDYLLTSLDNIALRPLVESFIVNSIPSKEKKNETNSLLVSDRTQYILKKLGFKWVKVNSKHIQKMLEYCKEVEFL